MNRFACDYAPNDFVEISDDATFEGGVDLQMREGAEFVSVALKPDTLRAFRDRLNEVLGDEPEVVEATIVDTRETDLLAVVEAAFREAYWSAPGSIDFAFLKAAEVVKAAREVRS